MSQGFAFEVSGTVINFRKRIVGILERERRE